MPRRLHMRIAPRAARVQARDDARIRRLRRRERARVQLRGALEVVVAARVRSRVCALAERRRQRASFLASSFQKKRWRGEDR